MRTMSEAQLATLLEGARTIEKDGLGLKVACLSNGDFLKLFRRKRLFSSAIWSPPSRRFADNASRLRELGVAAPRVRELLRINRRRLTGVIYEPLPGETLRSRWRASASDELANEVERFGMFLGQLHQSGVYFRSLHLGNVLHLPDGNLGLIDLSDMKIEDKPLDPWKRQRNLQHILRYPEDIHYLVERHRQSWIRGYREACGDISAQQFADQIARMF
jgi:tRNA A-37 threonylcarbamoyl transferase component Bud32